MRQQIPNLLTIARAIMAFIFFVLLSQYRYKIPTGDGEFVNGPGWALWWANGFFIAAALTDFFDGYLARKWHVESKFGRIMDPFCDKVLIIGAFIFLAGPRFVDPTVILTPNDGFFANIMPGNMVTGVYPWMVAIILARELLVTGIRGEMEGSGHKFGANMTGKLKMVLQAFTVPWLLGFVYWDPNREGREWLAIVASIMVYSTVIMTVLSGLPYISAAAKVAREEKLQKTADSKEE